MKFLYRMALAGIAALSAGVPLFSTNPSLPALVRLEANHGQR